MIMQKLKNSIRYLFRKKTLSTKNFDVVSQGCRIPSLNPFSEELQDYIFKVRKFKCKGRPRLFISNETHLILNKKNLKYYNATSDEIRCRYRKIRRSNLTKEPDRMMRLGEKFDLGEVTRVEGEFVQVYCRDSSMRKIYWDAFDFVPVKTEVPIMDDDMYNVIIFGIDNFPRMSVHRNLPKTLKYLLKELDAIEYFGYTKIGENTFPNIIPLLVGKNVKEIKSGCWKDMIYFDKCDFVWNEYKKAGYVTSTGEDNANIGMFIYNKFGFLEQPVDHYWNTFSALAQKWTGNIKLFNCIQCLGDTPMYISLQNYVLKYLNTYRKVNGKVFGFFWVNSLSHDSFNYPQVSDAQFKKFFQEFREQNDTILIFLSDHGFRWYPIRATLQGKIESNLPALYIILPNSFKAKHPKAVQNLRINARRLTTHFDLHQTLKDISRKTYNTDPPPPNSRGISLFKVVPDNRTCKSAGIQPTFCPCNKIYVINKWGPQVALMVKYTILHLNSMISKFHQCHKLVLWEILEAKQIMDATEQIYNVIFVTNPNKALYETCIECQGNCMDKSTYVLCGPVSRFDFYGNQSNCIKNSVLKLYCACKKIKYF